jgi:hypothetical protein
MRGIRSLLIPKLLVCSSHYWLAVSGYVVLFNAPSTTDISAIMLYPVRKLLATMNVFKQHLLRTLRHIPLYNRNQHEG